MTLAEQVQLWSDRKLRRYVRIAGRIWPDDQRVIVATAELDRRNNLKTESAEPADAWGR